MNFFVNLFPEIDNFCRVLADGHIPWSCEAFCQLHGPDLVNAPSLLRYKFDQMILFGSIYYCNYALCLRVCILHLFYVYSHNCYYKLSHYFQIHYQLCNYTSFEMLRNWRLLMIKLWNHNLLDPRTFDNCSLILEKLQNECPGPSQS